MPRVLTYTEGNTEAFTIGENVEIRRSPQAVACRKRYAVELGKPHVPGSISSEIAEFQVGRREVAICHWGVLSGIVLRGWESQPQGMVRTMTGKDLTEGRSPQRKLVPDM
jgi:hypothetical protein